MAVAVAVATAATAATTATTAAPQTRDEQLRKINEATSREAATERAQGLYMLMLIHVQSY